MSQTKTKKKKTSKELPSGSTSVPWRAFRSGLRNVRIQSKTKDEQEDSKLTENGLLFCRWSLGRPKTFSGDVFEHTDSIGSF